MPFVMNWSSEEKFEKAIELYSQAIEIVSDDPIYFGNRSFAYLKTELYGSALADATKAIELDRNYAKVYCCQTLT